MQKKAVNLLWTSGWDSTYRLIDLISKGKIVQPYYIHFKMRKSSPMELKTMENIVAYIRTKDNSLKNNILPIKIIDAESIAKVKEIEDSYNRLLEIDYLGNQYIYISSFARNNGINDLELSIHIDDRAYKFIEDYVVLKEGNGESVYEIPESTQGDAAVIFKGLRFPLLHISKVEMEKKAREKGFSDVLEMTWFCHTPTKNGEPCGTCAPCIYTIEEGLGRRVPFKSRIKAKPAKVLRSLKRSLIK